MADETNLLSLTQQTDMDTINGRAWVTIYDAVNRRKTTTSPAGRTSALGFDEKGRLTRVEPPGYPTYYATDISYGPSGEILAVAQGSRTTTVSYFGTGEPQSITDPLWRTTSFTYDLAGRVLTEALPGSRTIRFDYDGSGNMTSLVPPGRPAHGFGYTPMQAMSSYAPPPALNTGLVGTTYGYNLAGALAQVLLPDQSLIVRGYDAAGRLSSVTTDAVTWFSHDAQGRIATVTAPDVGVGYGYDGFLKTSETWSGTIAGVVSWTYDSDFRVATIGVNGSAASYQYDADSLLTGAGELTIGREAGSGRVSGTTLGVVSTNQSYNAFGERATFGAIAGGNSVYSYTLSWDLAGRISGKTEMVQGANDSYVYGYDDAGRLAAVTKNGHQIASYVYDANGNRLQKTSDAGTELGSYDDQDRMYAYGNVSYSYQPNGELASKTFEGQTTWYDYDRLGNLRGVILPDGRSIEYVIDGLNRRVGKKVNGALVEGFFYEGQLRPVAWLDGAGNVYARFVYGNRVNVPEYMVTAVGTFRILTDHLGSPRLVVNASNGAVAQRVDYDEWGQVLADTNPGFQPFGFGGGLYDRDTGLIRFGARDYDPSIGRWTNKDPIRFAGGTTNLYEYVGNDPVSRADPSGLCTILCHRANVLTIVPPTWSCWRIRDEQNVCSGDTTFEGFFYADFPASLVYTDSCANWDNPTKYEFGPPQPWPPDVTPPWYRPPTGA